MQTAPSSEAQSRRDASSRRASVYVYTFMDGTFVSGIGSGFDVDNFDARLFGSITLAAVEREERTTLLLSAHDHESIVGIDAEIQNAASSLLAAFIGLYRARQRCE